MSSACTCQLLYCIVLYCIGRVCEQCRAVLQSALAHCNPSVIRENLVEVPTVTWDDVGGLDGVKQELRELIHYPVLHQPSYLHDYLPANYTISIVHFRPLLTLKSNWISGSHSRKLCVQRLWSYDLTALYKSVYYYYYDALHRRSCNQQAWPHHQVAVAKFSKSTVYRKVPEGTKLIFGGTWISLKHSLGWIKGSSHAKNQLYPSSHFDTIPGFDGWADRGRMSNTRQHILH